MAIQGIVISQSSDGATLCHITDFSDELRDRVRETFASIAHGAATAAEPVALYSYEHTLKEFMERYSGKDENTKKGMIGELLAHILIPDIFDELTSVSVYFNKEERSIKKGFDIIYCNLSKGVSWYSEVKSGHRSSSHSPDEANETLLERARKDLVGKFLEGRKSLWLSALTDVTMVLDSEKAVSVKVLLSEDSPLKKAHAISEDKNAILVSMLYEDSKNPVSLAAVNNYLKEVRESGDFKDLIVFSVQKHTYEKVASFLEAEAEAEAEDEVKDA